MLIVNDYETFLPAKRITCTSYDCTGVCDDNTGYFHSVVIRSSHTFWGRRKTFVIQLYLPADWNSDTYVTRIAPGFNGFGENR